MLTEDNVHDNYAITNLKTTIDSKFSMKFNQTRCLGNWTLHRLLSTSIHTPVSNTYLSFYKINKHLNNLLSILLIAALTVLVGAIISFAEELERGFLKNDT